MNLRKLLRIARWESTKSLGTVDRRTVVALGLALVVIALIAPTIVGAGGLDDGIYQVAIDDDHEYYPAVESHGALRTVESPTNADLRIEGQRVFTEDAAKSQAALTEFRDAVEAYNHRRLLEEDDQEAAFPVVVEIRYESRDRGLAPGADDDPDGGDVDLVDTDGDDADTTPDDAGAEPTDSEPDGPANDDEQLPVPGIGGGGLTDEGVTGTPGDIDPPFPFASLLLAFFFVIPMNFVIQAYGSTIMDERLNRRGELLLVAPVSRLDVVGGKTLPYFVALVAVTVLIAALVGGGVLSVFAVVPIALLFLAATFVGAMFARSYKELTFVTVTVSVVVTTYVFVPAIFTDVTPIALISPLTLVVFDLQGEAVSAVEYAFSTGPFYLASIVLFGLGIGVYREEDMFTQRPIHLKVLDALAAHVHGYRGVAAMSAALIPFVFVVQLLTVSTLFLLPLSLSLPFLLLTISIVEELAKSVHVFAGYVHDRFERSIPAAIAVGGASGAGFFAAEKLTHASQLVGLHEIELGRVAFAAGADVEVGLAVVLFFAPLALHVVTATISTLGARVDGRRYLLGLGAAVAVHTAYNLGVIALVL